MLDYPSHEHALRNRLAPFLLLPAVSAVLIGQTVISVRPGLIHHSEGDVALRDSLDFRADSGRYRHLEEGQHLVSREGRVEVFLNHGTAMRLGEHGDVEMVKAGLDEIQVRLVQGSTVFEVRDTKGIGAISVLAGDRTVRFDKKGVYRLDHRSGEAPVLKVFRGSATISSPGEEQQARSKQAMVLAARPESLTVQPFDRAKKDVLDKWQQKRSELVAEDERARQQAGLGSRTNLDLLWDRQRSYGRYGGSSSSSRGGVSTGSRAPTSGGGGAPSTSSGRSSGGGSSPRGRVGR